MKFITFLLYTCHCFFPFQIYVADSLNEKKIVWILNGQISNGWAMLFCTMLYSPIIQNPEVKMSSIQMFCKTRPVPSKIVGFTTWRVRVPRWLTVNRAMPPIRTGDQTSKHRIKEELNQAQQNQNRSKSESKKQARRPQPEEPESGSGSETGSSSQRGAGHTGRKNAAWPNLRCNKFLLTNDHTIS